MMSKCRTLPERIYNPITAMGFSAMFTFQLTVAINDLLCMKNAGAKIAMDFS